MYITPMDGVRVMPWIETVVPSQPCRPIMYVQHWDGGRDIVVEQRNGFVYTERYGWLPVDDVTLVVG
jgi:hypothetical protein